MTIRELGNIIRTYRDQQQRSHRIQSVDEVRARELLRDLIEVNNRVYNTRKENWFASHPDKTVFEPTPEEEQNDITLDEWFFYFVNRISMTPEQRYYEALEVGASEEEAQEKKNKTDLAILEDYKGYPNYDMVLNIWIE